MSIIDSTLSQKRIFSIELQKLAVDVTTNDRKEAAKKLGLKAHSTIVTYLKGDVRNNDLAASLIAFFRRRIAERNKVLG